MLRANFESIVENIDLLQSNNPNCNLIIFCDFNHIPKNSLLDMVLISKKYYSIVLPPLEKSDHNSFSVFNVKEPAKTFNQQSFLDLRQSNVDISMIK